MHGRSKSVELRLWRLMTARRTAIIVRASLVTLLMLVGIAGCGAETNPVTSSDPHPSEVSPPGNPSLGSIPVRSSVEDNPPGWPPIEFEPPLLDFGNLPPGGTGTGLVKIWNVGEEPLKIVRSITSCGCTVAENLAGREIPPGGFTEFSTTMNMKSGLGEKKEKISIVFAGYTETFAVYYFMAEVSLPIRVTPPYIRASDRVANEWVHTTSGELRVESTDGKPFRILGSHGEPPEFIGFDPATDPPAGAYTIRWDLDRLNEASLPWFWVIETDRADCPVVDVRVRHESTQPTRPHGRPWVPKDQRILVGEVRDGDPFEVATKIEFVERYTPDPMTAGVTSDSPFLEAQLLEAQQDDQFLQFRIRITPVEAKPGLLYGILTLNASGYTAQLRIIGRVVE